MFHLFKKVYLDFDARLDMGQTRVICSDWLGGVEDHTIIKKIHNGQLIATAKSIETLFGENATFKSFPHMLEELNDICEQTNDPIYIYCDLPTYYKFIIKYFKLVLPNCGLESTYLFVKSHMYKEITFANYRFSPRFYNPQHVRMMYTREFTDLYNQTEVDEGDHKSLLSKIYPQIRIEFLLASYLYDKRQAQNLANAMTPLVRKDIEKFMMEHKELMCIHFLRPEFQRQLGVQNGPYTIENFYQMSKDPSPLVQIMFDKSIWGENSEVITMGSSRGEINFKAFTPEKIEHLKEFSKAGGTIWSENTWYTAVRSELDKFDFIKMFITKDKLTIDDVEELIKYESTQIKHSAGSFYSLNIENVNFYFIDYIFLNINNKDALAPFVLS